MISDPNNPDFGLAVRFSTIPVENPRKSRDAGRAIFEDVDMIDIMFPGDNKRKLSAPVDEMHYVAHLKVQMTYAERFAPLYDAFKEQADASMIQGTPVSYLQGVTAAKAAEFAAQNIRTVEQLAALSTPAIRKMGMGTMSLVNDAKDYLEIAKGTSDVAELKAEIERLRAELTPAPVVDPYSGFDDADLRNMLLDAGVTPNANWKRDTLVKKLKELSEKKEAA